MPVGPPTPFPPSAADALRIYCDSSAIQRPLDGLATPEEVAEAECVLALLQRCARGNPILVWSGALEEECVRLMPPVHAERLRWVTRVRDLARVWHDVTEETFSRAARIQKEAKLTAFDALH